MEDSRKTIKCKLKKILCTEYDNSYLYNVIKRANFVSFICSYFIRSYVLKMNDQGLELPILNKKFIMNVFRTIQKSSCGPKSKDTSKNDLEKYYNSYFKNIMGDKLDGKNLSYIIAQTADSMEVAYRNNIVINFFKYLSQFINQQFLVADGHDKKELHKLKMFLLGHDKLCPKKYSKWVTENKHKILPPNCTKGYHYDIKKDPFRYMKYMFYMNGKLEKGHKKTFQCVPLRTDVKDKYITINTNALVDILPYPDKQSLLSNIRKKQKDIWDMFINIKNKRLKGYSFNYQIQTDGFSVSINYIKNDLIDIKNKIADRKLLATKNKSESKNEAIMAKTKTKKTGNEFSYIEDLVKIKNKLCEIKKHNNENKIVYIDPGKRDIGTFMDGENKFFKYSSKRRICETKRKKYNRLITNKTKKTIIDGNNTTIKNYNDLLSNYNKKTNDIHHFDTYCCLKIKLKKKINEERKYDEYLRKLKWHSYINNQKHESKIMNEVANKYGKDTTMIIGDWGDKNNINYISTPSMSFKRLLKNNFKTYLIDEYNTSKLHNMTLENIGKNNMMVRKDNKSIKLHSVLTFKMGNSIGCINRDRNAVKNMKEIVGHLLEHKKRPKEFINPFNLNQGRMNGSPNGYIYEVFVVDKQK
jgi:hypothetical protein